MRLMTGSAQNKLQKNRKKRHDFLGVADCGCGPSAAGRYFVFVTKYWRY